MRGIVVFLAFVLGGCASSSVMDLQRDVVQISSTASDVCGAVGAQQVAVKRAAIETIRRGYDSYMVLDGRASSNARVVGYTPVIANTYGSGTVNSYGNSATYNGYGTTTYSGGQPIVSERHDQALVVKMFKNGDPGSEKAIDARRVLGPEWKKIVTDGPGNRC